MLASRKGGFGASATCTLLGILAAVLALPPALGQPKVALSPAAKAAQEREEAVKTLELKFKRTEVIAKGGVSARDPPPLRPKFPVPDQETTLAATNRLVLDGLKFRYEDNHPVFVFPEARLHKHAAITWYDGSVSRELMPNEIKKGMGQFGTIHGSGRANDLKGIELLPLLLTFRPVHPLLGNSRFSTLKPSGVTLPIEGVSCEEYVVTTSATKEQGYWLDPSKGYVVRRIRREVGGHVGEQIDVRYGREEQGIPIPTSWVRRQYSPQGEVLTTTTFEVSEVRINQPQAAEEFDMLFPPATKVYDQRNNKFYRVEADGTMREVSIRGEELGPSVSQPGDSWYRRNTWLLVSVGVALLGLLSAYVWRRKRRVIS
ncbi:MAG TPA: hypothetical protein VEL76_38545 [Gemmataceae bacterium]|nr:hypothetical protein [Gemmataceae bacterium]